MIGLIDIGIGNINSVERALHHLGVKTKHCKKPVEVANCEKIIFPGVGNFTEASNRLSLSGMRDIIRDIALEKKLPILGICLGMQLMANHGFESGKSRGLGLIDADVTLLDSRNYSLCLPHVGWNDVNAKGGKLFEGIPDQSCFYFVHSYAMQIRENNINISYTNYGHQFCSAFEKANIFGVQFHPEKSQNIGLKLLKNFIEI